MLKSNLASSVSILKQNFIVWLFSLTRTKKMLLLKIFDSFVALLAFFLAFTLRFETIDHIYLIETYIGGLIAIISTLSVFIVQGLYNNIARYISIETVSSIAIGSALSCVVLFSVILLFKLKIPLSVSLIFGTFLCIFIIGIRLLIIYLSQNLTKKKQVNVAIYGAGAVGIQLMNALREDPNYSVRLFIDDNPELHGKNLGRVSITNFNHISKKIRNLKIKTLFLATPFKKDAMRQRVFDIITDYPIKVKTIPSISNLITGRIKIDELKDIKIEDLLGREPVKPNDQLMKKNISNKIVLVTGAGGSIGSELCRQIIFWKPQKLILIDISEFAIYKLFEELKQHSSVHEFDLVPLIGSVQDKEFIKKVFDRFIVDTIYHVAAYKHVPLMEQNVMQCIKNNVFGTLNVAELSIASKVKNFILVSTDKAVNPTNFMGASKRIAEIICKNLSMKKNDTCLSIVRFGNVLGSSGSVVPLFKKQIEKGGPITLTHLDVTRYFMTITEAAQLVIQAGSIAQGGDVFVLDMGKPIKILDLAKRMVNLSGRRPVLNGGKNLEEDDIEITISGLQPGEKLFEELTYNSNLTGTVHPRINMAVEKFMKKEEFKSLLNSLREAIRNNDLHKIYQNIGKVTNGIYDVTSSKDVFISKDCAE